MSAVVGENSYGKSNVRLVTVKRHGDRHELKDVTVAIRFEGDYAAAHAEGDNRAVLPTDTMKNTVYALARQNPVQEIEGFGITLVRHFLAHSPASSLVRVELAETPWARITVGGRPHDHAFARGSAEKLIATVSGTRDGVTVESGIADLMVLKTSRSGFEGFLRDRYTTLRETSDRILATAITARWLYSRPDASIQRCREQIRGAILETFADHDSRSVQHTLYAMGKAALARCDQIAEIHFSLPNKHHLLVDLSPFGLDNPNEIFVATEEPFGLIEATIRRGSSRH